MSQAKRILMLAPQPFFSARGTPFSVYYRALVMGELGYAVDILTYGQGQAVDLPGARIIRGPALTWLGAIKTGPSLLKIVHDLCLFGYFIGLQLKHRYRTVHAHEEAVFFCLLLKPLLGFRLIYDMHSSLPQQLTNFGFTESRTLIWLFEKLELWSLNSADAIITICPALAEQVLRLAPTTGPRHRLIENSIFDPVRLTAGNNNADDLEHQVPQLTALAGRRLVVYAGTLEQYQGIDLLLAAAAQLAARRNDFLLLIAGGNAEQVAQYQAQVSQEHRAQIVFVGLIAPNAARALNRRADVLVSPRATGNNTPLKTYEQLACGVPLVATAIESHTQVLTEEHALLVPLDADCFARAIERLLDEAELGPRLVAAAQAHYQQHYAKPVYTQKLAQIMELVS